MRAAVEAGADYVGFVFYGPSPRNVSIPVAQGLATLARGRSRVVALVVDADDDLIDAINAGVKPDFFQAHGSETPERLPRLRPTGVPVIKAIKVRDAGDMETARAFAEVAAMILFDAKAPETLRARCPAETAFPSTGRCCQPMARTTISCCRAGLMPDNVARAIEMTGAPIVDVSSGVETGPGRQGCRSHHQIH